MLLPSEIIAVFFTYQSMLLVNYIKSSNFNYPLRVPIYYTIYSIYIFTKEVYIGIINNTNGGIFNWPGSTIL